MKFYITENGFLGLPQEGRQLQSVQILCRLLFTAARIGEEKFIRLVFGTSAGRAAFEAYKNKPPLPENIADENGHEKIAAYLRSITERAFPSINKMVPLLLCILVHGGREYCMTPARAAAEETISIAT